MAPSSDRLPSEEALRWTLSKLTDKERAEFDSGWSKRLYQFEQARTVEAADALLAYTRGWVVSIMLQHDEEWSVQMAESAERFASGDVGEPVEPSELRELLGL